MDRRRFFRQLGPALGGAAVAPVAVFMPKPALPEPEPEFEMHAGDILTAKAMRQWMDSRASRVVNSQLAALRRQGLL